MRFLAEIPMSHDCIQCTLYSLPKRSAGGNISAAPDNRVFVHRIFILALAAGFVGSTYLGLHLWLMRTGSMVPWSNYVEMRSLHAAVQLYLFFGLFAVGFILQAAPTFLGIEPRCSKLAFAAPLLIVLGVGVEIGSRVLGTADSANGRFPGLVISGAGFALVGLALANVLRRSQSSARAVSFGLPMVVGLMTTAASTLLDPADPRTAVFVLWGGIGSFVFAAGQKFIEGSLGGSGLGRGTAYVFLGLHITTIFLLGAAALMPAQPQFFSLLLPPLALAVLTVFYFGTGLNRSIREIAFKPLAFALHTGFLWAVVGISGLGWPGTTDLVAHTWALGWFAPLVVAVSSQIIGHLSDRPLFRPQTLIGLLILWQAVPLGRGFGHTLPGLQWAVSFAISIVFIAWGFQMAARILAVERKLTKLPTVK